MFSIFSSKVKPDLSFIGVDMHSHLLPGLDDGLQDIDKTIDYILELQEMGYTKLICTPHILADVYPNSPETILPKLELVRQTLQERNINMEVQAGAEYMVDIDFENYLNSDGRLLTLKDKYLLIEMSYAAPSSNLENVIFQLRLKGYQPVLAHPERYSYYYNTFKQYERFVELGCLLQVNILSLLGYYGEGARSIATKLFKQNMVTFVGTDMHHDNHLNGLKELASKKSFYKTFEGYSLKNKLLLS